MPSEFKAYFTGAKSDIAELRRGNKQDRLGVFVISEGQKYHEGQRMASTLVAARRAFAEVVIIKTGGLQAYNLLADYVINLGENDPLPSQQNLDSRLRGLRAQKAGDASRWASGQVTHFKHVQQRAKLQVLPWQFFLDHKDFKKVMNFVIVLYHGLSKEDADYEQKIADYKEIYEALTHSKYAEDTVCVDTVFQGEVKNASSTKLKSQRKKLHKPAGSGREKKAKVDTVRDDLLVHINREYVFEEVGVYIIWLMQWRLNWAKDNKDMRVYLAYPAKTSSAINHVAVYYGEYDELRRFRPLTIGFKKVETVEYEPTRTDSEDSDRAVATFSSSSSSSSDTGTDVLSNGDSMFQQWKRGPQTFKKSGTQDINDTLRNFVGDLSLMVDDNTGTLSSEQQPLVNSLFSALKSTPPCGNIEECHERESQEFDKLSSEIKTFINGRFTQTLVVTARLVNRSDNDAKFKDCVACWQKAVESLEREFKEKFTLTSTSCCLIM